MGCESCAKIILLVFNLLFFIVGAVMLGVGIWVTVDGSIFISLLTKIPDGSSYGPLIGQAAYILIGAGAAMFIIAFLGCCGAMKKNKCMLITYAIVVGIMLTLQIATIVTVYFFSDKILTTLNTGLASALNTTYKSTFTATNDSRVYTYASGGDVISKGIDAIQIEFGCCGLNNYTDYPGNFPYSCCPSSLTGKDLTTYIGEVWKGDATSYTTSAPQCPQNVTYAHGIPGCADAIKNYVIGKSYIFMGIAGGAVGVQIFLIIFACCVAKHVDDDVNQFV